MKNQYTRKLMILLALVGITSTLQAFNYRKPISLGEVARRVDAVVELARTQRSVQTYETITAYNINLVNEVPLCSQTGTRAAGAETSTNVRQLTPEAYRNVLMLLNDPQNFGGSASAATFEPHMVFEFKNQQNVVVLKVEVSMLSNSVKTWPRMPAFTTNQLSAKGIAMVAEMCNKHQLTLVDAAYVGRFANLSAAQKTALQPYLLAANLPVPNTPNLGTTTQANATSNTNTDTDELATTEVDTDLDEDPTPANNSNVQDAEVAQDLDQDPDRDVEAVADATATNPSGTDELGMEDDFAMGDDLEMAFSDSDFAEADDLSADEGFETELNLEDDSELANLDAGISDDDLSLDMGDMDSMNMEDDMSFEEEEFADFGDDMEDMDFDF